MKKDIGKHIINRLDLQDIVNVLSDELSGSELNSVLLDVFNRRVQKETPSSLLAKYEKNKFVKPANIDLLAFKEKELNCYKVLAAKGFEPVELSPVAQLGTNSVVATVDQKKVLSALRNTEVMADPTNAIALYYSAQKKKGTLTKQTCNYCNISRVLRAQAFSDPNFTPHFTVLSLVSCGRDTGSYSFEKEELFKQIALSHESCKEVFGITNFSVEIIPCKGYDEQSPLIVGVVAHVESRLDGVKIKIAEPEYQNDYYYGFRIKFKAEIRGVVYEIGDGGLLNWTQQLLTNQKERMMTTGTGFQMLYQLTK
jgi:hypothetical protein